MRSEWMQQVSLTQGRHFLLQQKRPCLTKNGAVLKASKLPTAQWERLLSSQSPSEQARKGLRPEASALGCLAAGCLPPSKNGAGTVGWIWKLADSPAPFSHASPLQHRAGEHASCFLLAHACLQSSQRLLGLGLNPLCLCATLVGLQSIMCCIMRCRALGAQCLGCSLVPARPARERGAERSSLRVSQSCRKSRRAECVASWHLDPASGPSGK